MRSRAREGCEVRHGEEEMVKTKGGGGDENGKHDCVSVSGKAGVRVHVLGAKQPHHFLPSC